MFLINNRKNHKKRILRHTMLKILDNIISTLIHGAPVESKESYRCFCQILNFGFLIHWFKDITCHSKFISINIVFIVNASYSKIMVLVWIQITLACVFINPPLLLVLEGDRTNCIMVIPSATCAKVIYSKFYKNTFILWHTKWVQNKEKTEPEKVKM